MERRLRSSRIALAHSPTDLVSPAAAAAQQHAAAAAQGLEAGRGAGGMDAEEDLPEAFWADVDYCGWVNQPLKSQ